MNKEEFYDFLSEYRHMNEVIDWLHRNTTLTNMTARRVRTLVDNLNTSLLNEGSDLCIVSNDKGFLLTSDPEEILRGANRKIKQGLTMLIKGKAAKRRIADRYQLKLTEDEDPSIRELLA